MNIDGQADVQRRTGFEGLILKVFYGWLVLWHIKRSCHMSQDDDADVRQE